MPGLRDLIDQLKNRRRQQLQQYNMDSVVDDLQERLDDILQTERSGIDRRLDEGRRQVDSAEDDARQQQENLYQMLEQRAQRNRESLTTSPRAWEGRSKS